MASEGHSLPFGQFVYILRDVSVHVVEPEAVWLEQGDFLAGGDLARIDLAAAVPSIQADQRFFSCAVLQDFVPYAGRVGDGSAQRIACTRP